MLGVALYRVIVVNGLAQSDVGKSRKCVFHQKSKIIFSIVPKSFAPQTKVWEGWTKDKMRIFEALFKVVSTLFGLRIVEN
jgi:hypothetical protein